MNNPHSPVPAPNLPLGLAAIEKAKAGGAKTQRERDYIEALSAMYVDYDKTPHQTRVQAYLKAMETLAGRYPADDEAQIFQAIALNVAASPSDKTYANQLKGAAILEPILERQPQHPGVAHYLIHLYDYPPIAAKGLPPGAALRKNRAERAACAAHAVAYIYAGRLLEGFDRGKHGIRSSRQGQQGIRRPAARPGLSGLCLSAAWSGQGSARGLADIEATRPDPDAFAGAFSQAAAPARFMVERGDWNGAANLEVKPSKFPHAMAITYFARAIGAARSGKIDAAKVDAAKLAELRDRLREAQNSYWAGQVDVQQQVAAAWVLYAEGNRTRRSRS